MALAENIRRIRGLSQGLLFQAPGVRDLLPIILESLEEIETRLRELETRTKRPSHVQAGEKTVGGKSKTKLHRSG
jgi:hypothetical protein